MQNTMLGLMVMSLIYSECVFAAPEIFKEQACYIAKYDSAHMSEHPKQQVRELRLLLSPISINAQSTTIDNWIPAGNVRLAAYFKNESRGLFADEGICTAQQDGSWRCGIDCDGGTWRMRKLANGSMLVKPETNIRLTTCGDEEVFRDIVMNNDHKAFKLAPTDLKNCFKMN